ncbi:putative GTPase activating protein for Arf [Aspergillus ruber CBS 135680]|uniref:Arf-GAP domain-containing protein n=1 Tax=Aspergillus ruber (strain CBS 135680) TaxID=1388766 RepID=A0A017S5M4_ASPRC|nr:uncharacterized protein EURHEDRAFT_201059 [Aspergillus ruber CBS 135680]EYE92257.1 hypothetical protein EURHEDRAFT_201059 [Aspergillus ruber CBS 135680]
MGLFLCMRCAALHRKLGTHISKVKSLTMDSWSSDQVDNMKSHGNNIMNKIFNPKNVKPPVPTDIDESDSCMERYIRQKYQHRSLEDGKPKPPSRHDSGYTKSPEGSPPPLPPKNGKFFGFGLRGSSSTSNLRRFSTSKPTSPRSQRHGSPPPPVPVNTASQGMGASIGDMGTPSFEAKLATLREMGFPDDRRNAVILRGLGGNMERTIESLTRLGEGSGASTRPISRARTPNPTSTSIAAPTSPARATTSYNPFDQLDSKPANQSTEKSYNPFDVPNTQPQSANLEASFQGLQVSQPLFPHSTGGYPLPNRQNSLPQPLYQQSATPPVTATFAQNGFLGSTQTQTFDGGNNPFFQSAQPQPQAQPQVNNSPFASQFPNNTTQNNPFFNQLTPQYTSMQQPQQTQSVAPPVPSLQHANTMPMASSTSPLGQSSPFLQQQQQQQQPQQQLLQPQTTPLGQSNPYNPFQSMTAPSSPQNPGFQNPFQSQFQPQAQQSQPQPQQPQQSQFQPQAQQQQPQYQPQFQQQQSTFQTQPTPQQLIPQATGRVDKGSILSLYNIPSPTPTLAQQQQQQQQAALSPVPGLTPSLGSTPASNVTTPQQPQQPLSAGLPQTASRNPFMSSAPASAPPTQPDFGNSPFSTQPQQFQQQPFQQAQPQQQPQQQSGLGIGMGMNTNMNMGMGMGMKPTGPPPSSLNNMGFARNHSSQQSVDLNGLQSGRHSPDAFASLSARYG